MDGVICTKRKKYCLFEIEDFSDELKNAIREQFASICHGSIYAGSKRKLYGYKITVNDFIKRYDGKKDTTKKGMIGELLVHLLVKYFFDEFEIVSTFFNMEERSIKKGYDVVLTEKSNPIIWLIEVKSGELHKGKDSNETMNDLINTAKRDLDKRLNEENKSLWYEAINGAKISYEDSSTMKDAVMNILMDLGDAASDGINTSNDKNVITTGVLFSDMTDSVLEKTEKDKQKAIEAEGKFNQVYVLAVHKGTYEKIYDFIKSEA